MTFCCTDHVLSSFIDKALGDEATSLEDIQEDIHGSTGKPMLPQHITFNGEMNKGVDPLTAFGVFDTRTAAQIYKK